MRNPLESEETAFRFVLGTLAYLAPIVLASWIAAWLGFAVFVLATAAAVMLLRRPDSPREPADAPGRAEVADTWRVLVLAGETLGSEGLTDAVARLGAGAARDVLLVCPVAASSPSGAPTEQPGREAAGERLRSTIAHLRMTGISARGSLFEGEPSAALRSALANFAADEVVISSAAGERAWESGESLVAAARAQFHGAVTHVVEGRSDEDPSS